MANIKHPLFGYLGAFWMEGVDKPFYSLHEAKDYQRAHGGDILNWEGKLIYAEPPPPPVVEKEEAPAPIPAVASGIANASGNWFTRLFSRS